MRLKKLIRKMGIHQGVGLELIDGNCKLLGMNFREGLNCIMVWWMVNDHCGVDGGNPSHALIGVVGCCPWVI